ncbi:MAG: thioredoxin family protein [Bacteroidaceae bacterium]|nr:thioredoxin family protein [Bacteroidaceae bacterium]
MKKLLVSFMLLFAALQANAQFGNVEPVTFENNISVNGSEGTIEFEAYIEPGYHLYSTNIPEGGPVPMSVTYRTVEGAEIVGELVPGEGAVTEMDAMFEMMVSHFSDNALFTQKVKLLGGKYRIQGTLRFQSCSDTDCIPGRYDFDITGEAAVVKAEESKPAAKPEKPAVKETPAPVKKAEAKPAAPVAKAEEPVVETPAAKVEEPAAAPVVEQVAEKPADKKSIWEPVTDKFNMQGEESAADTGSRSLWITFILGFGGGLLALLTPCVWPIIPMTVSFFLKRSKERKQAVREALIYGASIVVIYLVLGLAVTLIFGAGALNALSTNAVFNIIFCLMLLVFGASFLGGFEITLPSSWTNKMDEKAGNTSGLLSIFFMAFTLTLVSFSCTGPIIGFLLVEVSTSGAIFGPAIGMLGFALALALPFTLFAIFPSLLKQTPRSGSWMNTIKVVLGFVEIAFALKFFSVADLSYHWGLLDRETFLALWIALFAILGLYLMKVIRFPHDDADDKKTSVPGFFMGLVSIAFAVYMIPGLWGAPCKAISAFAPPMSTQDFNLYDNSFKPHVDDYELALEMGRREDKPVLLDFTGHGCVNCRNMESSVWSDDRVIDIMRDDYIVASLYVDDRTPLAEPFEVEINGKKVLLETVGDKWTYLQGHRFGANAQPFYVPVDNDGNPLCGSYSFNLDVDAYINFLKKGIKNYEK